MCSDPSSRARFTALSSLALCTIADETIKQLIEKGTGKGMAYETVQSKQFSPLLDYRFLHCPSLCPPTSESRPKESPEDIGKKFNTQALTKNSNSTKHARPNYSNVRSYGGTLPSHCANRCQLENHAMASLRNVQRIVRAQTDIEVVG